MPQPAVKLDPGALSSETVVSSALIFFAFFLLGADINSARRLIEQGKIGEALTEIQTVLRTAPDDPEVQYEAGELLRTLGADRAEKLQQLAPGSAEAHELLARSLEARGLLNDALDQYRAALRANPNQRGLHFLIGNVLWKKRDFENARPELEAELRLNPNHALANLRLGQVLLTQDQPSCLDYLRKAVAADDSSIEAHRSLGQAYRLTGDHEKALRQFRIVAERRPNDDEVHAQLAGEYRALGDAAQAKAEMEAHRRLLQSRAAAAQPK
jgi:tetratricopeptide (TPR) repeat protein